MALLTLFGSGCILTGIWFWIEQGFPLHGLFHKKTLVVHPLFISAFGLALVLFAYFDIKVNKK